MANVFTGRRDSATARAVTRLESRPPERKVPQGTSQTNRRRTDWRRRSRTVSPACRLVGWMGAVAGEYEPLPAAVPQREGEHALEALEARGSLVLVGVEDHLGVRPRREEVSLPPQVVPQLAGVVDLPVRHQPDGSVLVHQRLL